VISTNTTIKTICHQDALAQTSHGTLSYLATLFSSWFVCLSVLFVFFAIFQRRLPPPPTPPAHRTVILGNQDWRTERIRPSHDKGHKAQAPFFSGGSLKVHPCLKTVIRKRELLFIRIRIRIRIPNLSCTGSGPKSVQIVVDVQIRIHYRKLLI
jgi:hypothetical protein